MCVARQGQQHGRQPGPAAVLTRAHQLTQEQRRETDPVRVGELPRERRGDGAAPDRVLLDVQEDERRCRSQERRRKRQTHPPQRDVGEERQEEDAQDRPELEGDRHARQGESAAISTNGSGK